MKSASIGQIKYIKSLQSQAVREIEGGIWQQDMWAASLIATGEIVVSEVLKTIKSIDFDNLTIGQASNIIDKMKNQAYHEVANYVS